MPISFDGKKGEFSECVTHFTGKANKRTEKPTTSEEARKICGSLQASQEKETKFCSFAKLQLKEFKEDFHVSGYVATSHPDRAISEGFEGDIIPKSTLQSIVTDINNKYKPQAGAVSERHDHIKSEDVDMPIAGVLAPGTVATLQELPDGEWGAHVDTILSKTNPRYEEVKTNIEQGIYPGFSIEFVTNDSVPVEKEGKMYRMLTDIDTEGFGYANRRMIANPHAEYTDFGYKEISAISTIQNKKTKGEIKMETDEEKIAREEKEKIENLTPEEKKKKEEEAKKKKLAEAAKASKEGEGAQVDTNETKEIKVSAEDLALLTKFKEKQVKEAEEKKLDPIIKEKVQAMLKEKGFRDAPRFNTGKEDKPEFKELDNYQTALSEMKELDKHMGTSEYGVGGAKRDSLFKHSIDKQWKESARLIDALMVKGVDVYGNWLKRAPIPKPSMFKENNCDYSNKFDTVGQRMEMKELSRVDRIEVKAGEGAQVDTNLADSNWTYGSYFLSPVELNDIFQPVLVNQLNDQTTTFGRLQKVDFSGLSQIQFRARTGRNSTVGGYSEGTNLTYGTSFTGTVGRDKYQQPYCYYRVLVAVTGQAQRFAMAPGGMGDRWADEIKWSGQDLLAAGGTKGTAATGLNVAILGSGGGNLENISLGFEGLILGTSGTLYGKTLGTAATSTLHSHKQTLSTVNIDLAQLRKMIRLVQTGTGSGSTEIHSNSRVSDLAFFTHHIQIDFVKAIYQDLQRIVPTSGRVGFEGELSIDGVPMVADRQIETDDVFLINTANTKIAMNLPPTLEPLPVTADAQAAHIKTYFNLYSDAPGNNYWTEGFSIT